MKLNKEQKQFLTNMLKKIESSELIRQKIVNHQSDNETLIYYEQFLIRIKNISIKNYFIELCIDFPFQFSYELDSFLQLFYNDYIYITNIENMKINNDTIYNTISLIKEKINILPFLQLEYYINTSIFKLLLHINDSFIQKCSSNYLIYSELHSIAEKLNNEEKYNK